MPKYILELRRNTDGKSNQHIAGSNALWTNAFEIANPTKKNNHITSASFECAEAALSTEWLTFIGNLEVNASAIFGG